MEKIFLTTEDNKKIAGNYRAAAKPTGWVLLIHMMPDAKESWEEFAAELEKNRFSSLAIDLRGHGESDGGPDGYKSFSDEEHRQGINDIEAAITYLLKQGAVNDKIMLIGASIGANLALQWITENPAYKTAVLLSPGVNYKGIEAGLLAANLAVGQRVYLIGAQDDDRTLGNMAQQIDKIASAVPAGVQKEIKIYPTGGHGTDLLKNNVDLTNLIINLIA